jgi:hypothetical protein
MKGSSLELRDVWTMFAWNARHVPDGSAEIASWYNRCILAGD